MDIFDHSPRFNLWKIDQSVFRQDPIQQKIYLVSAPDYAWLWTLDIYACQKPRWDSERLNPKLSRELWNVDNNFQYSMHKVLQESYIEVNRTHFQVNAFKDGVPGHKDYTDIKV